MLGNIKKNDIFSLRLPPDLKLKLDEVSELTGESASSVIKACMLEVFNRIFDEDGYVINDKNILRGRGGIPIGKCLCHGRDVAKAFSINYSTLRYWCVLGMVKTVKKNGSVYVLIESVEDLLNGGKSKHNKKR